MSRGRYFFLSVCFLYLSRQQDVPRAQNTDNNGEFMMIRWALYDSIG